MKKQRFPEHVSDAVVRAAAGEVFLLALLALLTRSPWPALVLSVDFALRAFVTPRWSFLAILANKVFVPALALQGSPIPFPPKRFAASIGFLLSASAFLLWMFGVGWGLTAPLAVLCLFSALESFLGFCAGCKIYGLLMHWNIVPEHNCPQCSYKET
jgi:hypothetical protein